MSCACSRPRRVRPLQSPRLPTTSPQARRASCRRGSGLAAASYIFSMGNTKAHKDLPTLLDAFQRLAPSRPGIRLVLAGEEPRGYLDARLKGEPRRRATFTGPDHRRCSCARSTPTRRSLCSLRATRDLVCRRSRRWRWERR